MKKKATLIIVHLENIYTMETTKKQDVVFSNAYLAIHHDQILAIGQGDYRQFIDSDTRIVEGRSHFAIPAFIEVDARYPKGDTLDELRLHQEYRYRRMKEGTLTLAMEKEEQGHYIESDVVEKRINPAYPVRYGRTLLCSSSHKMWKRYCISGADETFSMHHQLLLAQFLYLKEETDPMKLLAALTLYPARALGLSYVGTLKKGMQADILICHGNDLFMLFDGFHEDGITQIIKKGVRIYPHLLI